MSTTFLDTGDAASPLLSLSHWMKRVRLPLHAWSRRRRWVVALLIAVSVFSLGAHGWIVADLGGVEASRTMLQATSLHLANARHALAQLPALRREVGGRPGPAPISRSSGPWSTAENLRIVSELAAQNSVELLAIEPGAASGAGAESMRSLQLAARTDFVHLMAFLRGLSDLPVLIVPVDVTVRRDAATLSVSATLHVFDALRPAPSATSATSADAFAEDSLDSDDEENVVFYDPFSQPQMQAAVDLAGVSQLRLVGLLRDRTHGLALLDSPDGVTAVESGQQIGAERVTRVDALGITLANGNATRMLALTETS